MRQLLPYTILLLLFSCKQSPQERDIASNRPAYQHHNWTGSYEFSDGENIHTLQLIRGRVDADYQVAYSTSENDFGGSIWRLKDHDDSVQLFFINNFTDNSQNVPFTRGDLLFTLIKHEDGQITTQWHLVQPSTKGSFAKME